MFYNDFHLLDPPRTPLGRISIGMNPISRREAAFAACPAGMLSRAPTNLRHFHVVFRALVQQGRATLTRATRARSGQQLLCFVYRDCPLDVFKLILRSAVPTREAPPPLDPTKSSLTDGCKSDGGGCARLCRHVRSC